MFSHTGLFILTLIYPFIHGPLCDTIAHSRVFRSPNTLETPRNETVYLIISKKREKMTPALQATLYSVLLSNSIRFTLH